MYQIHVSGFRTQAQAEAFVEWYVGQGEQNACIWFEEREIDGEIDVQSMLTNCEETYPLTWNGTVLRMVVNPR